jgi:hypothetical protein
MGETGVYLHSFWTLARDGSDRLATRSGKLTGAEEPRCILNRAAGWAPQAVWMRYLNFRQCNILLTIHDVCAYFLKMATYILTETRWSNLYTEHHKPTTCTLHYAPKCSNYTPTCFEPSCGSSPGTVTISQIICTSNSTITRFGYSCL